MYGLYIHVNIDQSLKPFAQREYTIHEEIMAINK